MADDFVVESPGGWHVSRRLVVWHLDFASTRAWGEFTNPDANAPALDWTVVGPL